MYKTFEEYERLAYMSNLPKIAKLYAKLDDEEQAEHEIEQLYDKIRDLENDVGYYQYKSEGLEKKVETLEIKLRDIQDVIDE